MPITKDDKVKFLKHLLPKPLYSFDEIATLFSCSKSSIKYWVEIYEVPTIKVTGSPFVLQVNLVDMFLAADKKNRDENRLCGLDFALSVKKK
jgi:hypothetical protein